MTPDLPLSTPSRAMVRALAALPEEEEADAPAATHRGPRLTPAQRALQIGGRGPAMPTGLPTWDTATRGGLRAPGLAVVGGGPGAGKTMLVMQLARRYAAAGHPVVVVAADESADGLLIRYGQGVGIGRDALLNGEESARAELARVLAEAAPTLALYDASDEEITIEDAAAEALARATATGKTAVLVVDSIQTVRALGTETAADLRARVNAVMGALKVAAKSGLLVVCTCELARSAYRNKNQADNIDPLAAFKESGAIEYGCDLAIVLREEASGAIEVLTPKNRWGDKQRWRLTLHKPTATLDELPPEPGAAEPDPAAQFQRAVAAARQALADHPGVSRYEWGTHVRGFRATIGRAAVTEVIGRGEAVNMGTPGKQRWRLADTVPSRPEPSDISDGSPSRPPVRAVPPLRGTAFGTGSGDHQ